MYNIWVSSRRFLESWNAYLALIFIHHENWGLGGGGGCTQKIDRFEARLFIPFNFVKFWNAEIFLKIFHFNYFFKMFAIMFAIFRKSCWIFRFALFEDFWYRIEFNFQTIEFFEFRFWFFFSIWLHLLVSVLVLITQFFEINLNPWSKLSWTHFLSNFTNIFECISGMGSRCLIWSTNLNSEQRIE